MDVSLKAFELQLQQSSNRRIHITEQRNNWTLGWLSALHGFVRYFWNALFSVACQNPSAGISGSAGAQAERAFDYGTNNQAGMSFRPFPL